MKSGFNKAGKIYKVLAVLFTIAFWLYTIIDDWVFIEKFGKEILLDHFVSWTIWYLIYLLAFSFYYWLGATVLLLTYYKVILRKESSNVN